MRWIMKLMPLLWIIPALAGDPGSLQIATTSLAEITSKADFIALAQVRDTDYFTRRGIPVSGSAYLKVLIAYKASQADQIIEVYEHGVHEHECYFPNPSVLEEGRRYLLFLQVDPQDEGRFRGLPEGCALDVLVASDNSYELRYPVDGMALSDPIESLARNMTFSDGYAVVEDNDLLSEQRKALLNAGLIRAYGDGRWIYTRGVALPDVRKLMHQDTQEP